MREKVNSDVVIEVQRDPRTSKGRFVVSHPGMLQGEEGLHWLDSGRLSQEKTNQGLIEAIYRGEVIGQNTSWLDDVGGRGRNCAHWVETARSGLHTGNWYLRFG